MRSHAKAASAGSTKRLGKKSRPALLACVLAASVAVLALVVGSASGATTRFLVETFGSSAQPSFPADRGMAFDQGSEELYVIDSTNDTISRFDADGSAANFGALGSNVIDGEGTGDETPLGHLAFEANRQREQIAIDESGEASDGNVYATRSASDVVDIFASNGEYLGTLSESTEGGAFGEPCGVAVDDEGTVYVGDRGDDRIHVFDPVAAVPVNGDSAATSFATLTDPCTLAAGSGATDGFLFVARSTAATLSKLDAATGELKYEIATGASTVSVDPGTGHVFVARNTFASSSVDEYDASGAAEATLVSSFKPGSTVEGIALNSGAEQVYVARSSTENVEVFGPAAIVPDVVTSPPSSNTGVRATLAGTVNPDGVELDECFFEWGQGSGSDPYTDTVPCAETPAEIGAGTSPVAVSAEIDGLIPQGTTYHYRLVAANPNGTGNGPNQNFTTPQTVTAEAATGVTPTDATLNGTVNPDTAAISECVFEWGPPKRLDESIQQYPEAAPCVPGPGGITGESPVAVEADLSGLHPGTTYLYRLKAVYPSGGILSEEKTLQTSGPVIVDAWAQDVVRTEATLKAKINPEGSATTYRIEYGKTEVYGEETPEIAVGSDSSAHEVTRFLKGLTPGTAYHYRFIATNGDAENVGADQTLVTYEPLSVDSDCPNQLFRTGPAATLPDCRAYEMVSPVDKNGGDIFANIDFENLLSELNQAAANGNKLTYTSGTAFGDILSSRHAKQYIATRSTDGWSTHGIDAPLGESIFPNEPDPYADLAPQFKAFTTNLAHAWFTDANATPLMPEGVGGFMNFYRRDNSSGSYNTLTGEPPPSVGTSIARKRYHEPYIAGYVAADPTHVFFTTEQQSYEFVNGKLTSFAGSIGVLDGDNFGRAERHANVRNAVSDDGSRVFITIPTGGTTAGFGPVVARIDGDAIVPVSESVTSLPAKFWMASADGSEVVFSFKPDGAEGSALDDLYVFDVDTETPALIASDVRGVVEASDDLSHIYFISREVLDSGATAGEENLYLNREGSTSFVATVALRDSTRVEGSFLSSPHSMTALTPFKRTSRVTPDGSHLAFQSGRRLTDYDSADVDTGEPVDQVYIYDADEDELTCASCNPSGARPKTRLLPAPHTGIGRLTEDLAAAWLPTAQIATNITRALSKDGNRLFFNSFDALVPEDSNGAQDVYQWEAEGSGSCQAGGGCVRLISTGTSSDDSEFIDASADGDDVFIRTSSDIWPEDPGLIDMYDARVNGGFPVPVPSTPCVGDSCQTAPEPPIDATPASAAFRGAGNPVQGRDCGVAARRATKLSHRAKRLRRTAKRSARTGQVRRAKRLRKRSTRFARKAKGLSRGAKRCRRANRRATG